MASNKAVAQEPKVTSKWVKQNEVMAVRAVRQGDTLTIQERDVRKIHHPHTVAGSLNLYPTSAYDQKLYWRDIFIAHMRALYPNEHSSDILVGSDNRADCTVRAVAQITVPADCRGERVCNYCLREPINIRVSTMPFRRNGQLESPRPRSCFRCFVVWLHGEEVGGKAYNQYKAEMAAACAAQKTAVAHAA